MTIDAARIQKLLDAFKLEQLFNEPAWDSASLKLQAERLNQAAIQQMKLLLEDTRVWKLESKKP